MSLIRSSRLLNEPVLLIRPRRGEEPAAVEPVLDETVPAADAIVERDTVIASVRELETEVAVETESKSAAAPAGTWLTYEEYKQRFEAELSAQAEAARREGFERGQAEGLEQVQTEYAAHLETMRNLIASMRAALEQQIEGMSEAAVEIVWEAVTKIIGDAIVERDAVIASVREVVRRAKDRTRLVVRVSPSDRAILEDYEAHLVEGLSAGSVEIVADDRVELGGCLLETPAGNLDGRLEVQLARLRDALLNARAAAPEAEPAT